MRIDHSLIQKNLEKDFPLATMAIDSKNQEVIFWHNRKIDLKNQKIRLKKAQDAAQKKLNPLKRHQQKDEREEEEINSHNMQAIHLLLLQ